MLRSRWKKGKVNQSRLIFSTRNDDFAQKEELWRLEGGRTFAQGPPRLPESRLPVASLFQSGTFSSYLAFVPLITMAAIPCHHGVKNMKPVFMLTELFLLKAIGPMFQGQGFVLK